jgi:hypothetical protein
MKDSSEATFFAADDQKEKDSHTFFLGKFIKKTANYVKTSP